MRCSLLVFMASGVLFWSAGLTLAATQVLIPEVPLPERVAALLLEVNRAAFPTNPTIKGPVKGSLKPQATNEIVLRALSRPLWPDFTQMKRVRVRLGKIEIARPVEPCWQYEDQGSRLLLLYDTLNRGACNRADARIEPVDFAAELDTQLGAPVTPPTDAFGKPRLDSGFALSLLHRGIAAAWLGHTNQARQLFRSFGDLSG